MQALDTILDTIVDGCAAAIAAYRVVVNAINGFGSYFRKLIGWDTTEIELTEAFDAAIKGEAFEHSDTIANPVGVAAVTSATESEHVEFCQPEMFSANSRQVSDDVNLARSTARDDAYFECEVDAKSDECADALIQTLCQRLFGWAVRVVQAAPIKEASIRREEPVKIRFCQAVPCFDLDDEECFSFEPETRECLKAELLSVNCKQVREVPFSKNNQCQGALAENRKGS